MAAELLDDMTKINQAWYKRDNLVSPMHTGPSKEQLAKDQEKHENMAKMMIQLDLLIKNVMGGNRKSVNAVTTIGDVVYDNLPYKGGYSKEVHYIGN